MKLRSVHDPQSAIDNIKGLPKRYQKKSHFPLIKPRYYLRSRYELLKWKRILWGTLSSATERIKFSRACILESSYSYIKILTGFGVKLRAAEECNFKERTRICSRLKSNTAHARVLTLMDKRFTCTQILYAGNVINKKMPRFIFMYLFKFRNSVAVVK